MAALNDIFLTARLRWRGIKNFFRGIQKSFSTTRKITKIFCSDRLVDFDSSEMCFSDLLVIVMTAIWTINERTREMFKSLSGIWTQLEGSLKSTNLISWKINLFDSRLVPLEPKRYRKLEKLRGFAKKFWRKNWLTFQAWMEKWIQEQLWGVWQLTIFVACRITLQNDRSNLLYITSVTVFELRYIKIIYFFHENCKSLEVLFEKSDFKTGVRKIIAVLPKLWRLQ